MRSNTEEVIKSSKYPGRSYCHISPRKVVLEQNFRAIPFFKREGDGPLCRDNNLIEDV